MSLAPISSTYNQINSSSDQFNYTGLTRDEIKAQVDASIANSNYSGVTESALAKLQINTFVGITDINNYNIQRRAEESFFETAKLKSSKIGLARNLGYDIQRPIPAQAYFQIKVSWSTSGDLATPITVPAFSVFSYNSFGFLNESELKFQINYANLTTAVQSTKSYIVTPNDYYTYVSYLRAGTSTTTLPVVFDPTYNNDADYSRFTMLQGTLKYTKIYSGNEISNNQFNKKFQTYKIDDTSFSDYYGSNDYKADINTTGLFTRVAIAAQNAALNASGAFAEDNCFQIDRRSLLKPELVNNYNFIDPTQTSPTTQKVCLIRTAKDQNVDLKFGDGNYISLGLKDAGTAIFIQYLSTEGAAANTSYVKDNSIDVGFTQVLPGSLKLDYQWFSNAIASGQDIESNESIEINAPAIYASLDRLVTKSDFIVWLKKQGYSNTIVWGEAEERKFFKQIMNTSSLSADVCRRLFNLVMFCAAHPLYSAVNGNWTKQDLTVVNDLDPLYNYQAPFSSASRSLYNIMIKQDYITNDIETVGNSALTYLLNQMTSKSSFTLRPVYVSPFIHDFDIIGTVKIDSFINSASIKQDIQNKLYSYLNTINDFNSEIKVSNITEIINSFTGVKYSDIKILPKGSSGNKTVVMADIPDVGSGFTNLSNIFIPAINSYLSKYTGAAYLYYDVETTNIIIEEGHVNGSKYTYTDQDIDKNVETLITALGKFTMRNFMFELAPELYALGDQYQVTPSVMDEFLNALFNALSYTIRKNMIDSNGNISPEYDSQGKWVRGGYSLGNEIVSINIDNLQIKY